jgi:AcrR family transcriptional regulator
MSTESPSSFGTSRYIGWMETTPVGRPPVSGLTEALLGAAERIMLTQGFSSLTVDALVTEVGTTRPTFYRRFSNTAHVALTVVRNTFGTGSTVDTGSLHDDLLTLQKEEVVMFSSPLLRNNLSGLLEAARSDDELLAAYGSEFIGPRRANVARVIAAAIDRGEVAADHVDIDFVCDLLLGPILARALMPSGAALDARLAEQTTKAVLLSIGALPDAAATRATRG